MTEKLEQAKDLIESLAARKIGGTGIELNSEEVDLAYEVFNDYVERNELKGVDVKLPFDVIQDERREVKINWASNCFNCGHEEAIVYSTASVGMFHDGDEVRCCNCGHEGCMDANGEDTDISWDEGLSQDLPADVSQSLKEVP